MIKRVRQQKFDDMRGLLEDITRKVASGEVGNTTVEKLAYVTKELDTASSALEYALLKFVTCDPKMLKLKDSIRMLTRRTDIDDPVLITGPTGTGKELLARAFRKEGCPFVKENCAAIPENLAESIFFGHVKGAFTGANENHIGLLEAAGDGVIFLDEIGDMSLPIQAKFLHAIQDGVIRKVGTVQETKISCRFVGATRYDLEERVAAGKFREDLFARMMTFEFKVTGLQERPADIRVIFKALFPNKLAFDKLPDFPQTTYNKIYKYNVRAIETAIQRWLVYESYE